MTRPVTEINVAWNLNARRSPVDGLWRAWIKKKTPGIAAEETVDRFAWIQVAVARKARDAIATARRNLTA